ncbi:MAG: coproporphyrinogen dehydrogenase HemZ [Clostridiales bacterium]|nr:MAG: coproporphyrinogen dehydrogenase HemZ [Clostridiales bacterium]
MFVTLNGTELRYDVQSLCQTFFPLENFSSDTGRNLTVTLTKAEVEAVFYENNLQFSAKQILSEKFDTERFAVKKAVYLCLQKATGRSSPWGIMTGIKPAVFYNRLKEKYGDEAHNIFENEYLVLPQKIDLCDSVIKNRRPILDVMKSNDVGFYVSVPFCPTRCRYCSFVSSSTQNESKFIEPYINKLCDEIDQKAKFIKENNLSVTTVYIGGGTPTVLSPELLRKLLLKIQNSLDLSCLLEYTVEAGRPDTITKEKLDVIKSFGVNRISVNPQTLNENVLERIGRKHTVKDFFNAYELAAPMFDVNVDLIAGLPLDTPETFEKSLSRIIGLSPQNLTVHTLYLKRASDFALEDEVNPHEHAVYATEMIRTAESLCEQNEYLPYYLYRQKNTVGNCENVGFAKPGKQCFYNVYMMDDLQQIIAAGANATTKLDVGKKDFKRYSGTKFVYNYINEV